MKIGVPDSQTFWEFLTIALAICTFGSSFVVESLAVLCDNTAALQSALDLKGSGVNLAIARELAWRKARGRWAFTPGHLPAEQNTMADAISRLAAPDSKALPFELQQVPCAEALQPEQLWKLR